MADRIYYDIGHPAALSSVQKLKDASGLTHTQTRDFLSAQNVYTLHRPRRKHFQRRQMIAYAPRDCAQMDLMDMQAYSRQNGGYKYVLVYQDIFTKKVHYVPLKSKRPEETIRALKIIFREGKPAILGSDFGTEFVNVKVDAFLKKQNVKLYHTYSGVKMAIAERHIRYLRSMVQKIMYHTGSKHYIPYLKHIQAAYNNTKHTSTGMEPNKVTPQMSGQIFMKLFGKRLSKPQRFKFSVGDTVRISLNKGIFSKESDQNWSSEVFHVKRILLTNPPTYVVQDWQNKEITGGFYEAELQKIRQTDDYYDVDKVLRKRKRKDGTLEYFVSFRGYPPSANQWVSEIKQKN
jgi:hypothetical protein